MSQRKLPPGLHRGRQPVRRGIRQNLLRVAVGLEHLEDLKADLARGLDTL
jgi:O-succinylhomoserine sulfhydrylase